MNREISLLGLTAMDCAQLGHSCSSGGYVWKFGASTHGEIVVGAKPALSLAEPQVSPQLPHFLGRARPLLWKNRGANVVRGYHWDRPANVERLPSSKSGGVPRLEIGGVGEGTMARRESGKVPSPTIYHRVYSLRMS